MLFRKNKLKKSIKMKLINAVLNANNNKYIVHFRVRFTDSSDSKKVKIRVFASKLDEAEMKARKIIKGFRNYRDSRIILVEDCTNHTLK